MIPVNGREADDRLYTAPAAMIVLVVLLQLRSRLALLVLIFVGGCHWLLPYRSSPNDRMSPSTSLQDEGSPADAAAPTVKGDVAGALDGPVRTFVDSLLDAHLSPITCDYLQTAGGLAPLGVCEIKAQFTNKSATTIRSVLIVVVTLANGNLLLNADGEPSGVGATLTIADSALGTDDALTPGEMFPTSFKIGLVNDASYFKFLVSVLASVQPAS